MSEPMGMSMEQRRAILEEEIRKYVKKGFQVVSRTDLTAQLVKPKKFSGLWALLWFLVFGVGLIIYLIYYGTKRDEQVYLEVDEKGKVRRR